MHIIVRASLTAGDNIVQVIYLLLEEPERCPFLVPVSATVLRYFLAVLRHSCPSLPLSHVTDTEAT